MTNPETSERTAGGLVGKLAGKAKEAAGSVVGDDQLAREGRLQQAQGDVGGRHGLPGAHQQRVARELAQPLELGTHGRLAAVQADGRPGNAAFGDHGVEDPDEGQVDLVENSVLIHMDTLMALIQQML